MSSHLPDGTVGHDTSPVTAAPRASALAGPAVPAGSPARADVAAPRDRTIDVARVSAMAGVVIGHWLVTGLVINESGVLRSASPLREWPALAPATWVLQTLAVFFFAGGFAAVRSRAGGRLRPGARPDTRSPGTWCPRTRSSGRRQFRTRPFGTRPFGTRPFGTRPFGTRPFGTWSLGARSVAGRPFETGSLGARSVAAPFGAAARAVTRTALRLRPVAALLGGWAVVLAGAAAAGVPAGTLRTVAMLVAGPLWFLLPYLLLTAATGVIVRVVDRIGPGCVVPAVLVVAGCDAGALPGWLAVPAAWAVPWTLGVAAARDRLRGPLVGSLLLTGGTVAVLLLTVGGGGYPVSAVGVPGDGRSNLDPPSLVAVALALAQVGVVVLVRHRARPRPGGRVLAALNRAALPVYLSHQSVLVVTAAVALLAGRHTGLIGPPDDVTWLVGRLAWLPVLAAATAGVVWLTRRAHRPARVKARLRGTIPDGTGPDDPMEVIAVRDSDPPSRGRTARRRS